MTQRGPLKAYQYSVTSYERDLEERSKRAGTPGRPGGATGGDVPGKVSHGFVGMPGVFFNFDIAGLKMVRTRTRKSLAHFLTSTCAIVGGVLTVAGILDAAVHAGRIRMAATAAGGGHSDGSGSRLGGKLV